MNLPWLAPQKAALNRALDSDRLGHAPMLLGSPGVGKRALAAWLVRRLLCLKPDAGEPCGSCRACELIEASAHPDFFDLGLLEDKSEILVDQVRDFIVSLSLTPSLGRSRVGLISPADRLNRNAANALLKTLEEPAGNVWLVLVVDSERRLPATVLSRCQRRYVAVPDRAGALDWLTLRHGDRDAAACASALTLADGAPLLADGWLTGAGLEQGLAVRDALVGVLRGGADEAALIAEWQQVPELIWPWLARYAERWLRAILTGPDDALGDAPLPAPEPGVLDRVQLCWDRALDGIRLSGKPVRHDWMLRAWLGEWRRLAAGR